MHRRTSPPFPGSDARPASWSLHGASSEMRSTHGQAIAAGLSMGRAAGRGARLICCLLATIGASAPVGAQSPADRTTAPARPEVVAEYPNGTFLENLAALDDGRVVFTSYFDKTIQVLEDGKARTFARVSAHPVSILPIATGFIVSAHGGPFNEGPASGASQHFILLDPSGRETGSLAAPRARFLNGMVAHVGSRALVADSVAATIWQVDWEARTVAAWLTDPALGQDPAAKEQAPGANGLKRQGDRVVVSNTSRGTLSTIVVRVDGTAGGRPQLLARIGPVDDFAVGPGGELILATHGPQLLRRAPDGTISRLLETGCDGCTAVALVTAKDGAHALIVLTTGSLFDGGRNPARVLRLPYEAGR